MILLRPSLHLVQEVAVKILLKNGTILTMAGSEPEIIEGDLGIEDESIAYVGDTPGDFIPDKIIDASKKIIMPGLVNAHTHIAMSLMRHYADDLPFWEWLNDRILPMEEKLTPDDVYTGSLLSIAEMIRSGTTTFADMYFFMDAVAEAVAETGIRANISRGLVFNEAADLKKLDIGVKLFHDWHKKAGGRIHVNLAPHAPYTCGPEYLEHVRKSAEELGAHIHTHLSESRKEIETIYSLYNSSPIAYMEKLGMFRQKTFAAHCVYVSFDDIRILADYDVSVVNNPGSNFKLGNGFAPIPRFLNAGVNVALGTDGPASNNNLNVFEEMNLAALVNKAVHEDSTVVPAYTALQMATINGARALGREDEIGSLEAGKKADIILVDGGKPHFYPNFNPVPALVYAGQSADVDTVICNGRLLMEQGTLCTMNEDDVLAKAEKTSHRLALSS